MNARVRGGSRLARVVGIALGAGLMVCGAMLIATRAEAAWTPVPVSGAAGHVVLLADPYPFSDAVVAPGEPAHWLVQARLDDADEGSLSLELRKSGELAEHPDGLTLAVDTCSGSWTSFPDAPICNGDRRTWVVASPAESFAATSPVYELGMLTRGTPWTFLITLSIAGDAGDALEGMSGTFGLGFTATGDAGAAVPAVAVPADSAQSRAVPAGRLPATGASIDVWGWVLVGAAMTITGVALILNGVRRPTRVRAMGGADAGARSRAVLDDDSRGAVR